MVYKWGVPMEVMPQEKKGYFVKHMFPLKNIWWSK